MSEQATACPVPSRWACDALADELTAERRRCRALAAAEDELAMALAALDADSVDGHALDRYILALMERNALRDGAP